ncbi:MAG: hypothetical protein ACJ04Q_06710 [Flavobacteriales bacterium]
MAHIIALQGRANSGKTTSIKIFHEMLIGEGWVPVPNKRQDFGSDFLDIFEKDGERLGVTSVGDTYDDIIGRLEILINENCNPIVCACRTFDKRRNAQGELEGTVAATKRLSSSVEYHPTNVAEKVSDERPLNEADGIRLILAVRNYFVQEH